MLSGPTLHRGDRGSVAVAIVLMVTFAGLGAVLIDRAMADARAQSHLQWRITASAALDAGAASAVARIGAGEPAGSFTDSGSSAGISWNVQAAQASPTRWDVRVDARRVTAARAATFAVERSTLGNWMIAEWREIDSTTPPPPSTTTTTSTPPGPSPVDRVEYLVVGGGGAGASATGGGGGAGGFVTNVGGGAYPVTTRAYVVEVGAGGPGGSAMTYSSRAANGMPSRFDTVVAAGGGGGGENWTSGADGASGGGSGHLSGSSGAGTPGQGSRGGFGPTTAPHYGAGGGGGAGTDGGRPTNTRGGNGGDGRYSAITGQFYAGGGGGGAYSNAPVAAAGGRGGGGGGGTTASPPADGVAGTGGGGGGQRDNRPGSGAGGSGIVVIRYPGAPAATGGRIVTLGGYTLHIFDQVGSWTFEPAPWPGSPEPPTGVTAIPADGQLRARWVAPGNPGAGPITTYTVTATPGGATCQSSAPTRTCVITGLTNGTAYTVTVRATNGVGSSRASAPATATPGRVPDAPVNLVAAAGDGAAGVTFDAPADNGAPIVDYLITATPGRATATTTSTSGAVLGLTNGTSYTLTVQARNSFGYGPSSTSSSPVTPGRLTSVDYLVVGGGGAGAARTGGGGGAGGFLTTVGGTPHRVSPGSIPVVVGAGGRTSPGNYGSHAESGGESRFDSVTALGGGGGGENWAVGANGGSGGGSGHNVSAAGTGTAGQGNNGGAGPTSAPNYGAGGGGGAGSAGGRPTSTRGGAGGAGRLSPITNQFYAGGGGGGTYNNAAETAVGGAGGGGNGGAAAAGPTDGAPNTGGGGGGQRNNLAGNGSGGSGIVVIRYPGPPVARGGTVMSLNGFTLHVYTAVGTSSFDVP